MPGCGKAKNIMSAIYSGIGDFKGPVLMGFPSGHVKGSTFLTLPLGATAEINGNAPYFSILQSPFS
jgi:muramoyltetrapeptide carboxypeptidase LdcA involved in peptidoglycan recycling